MKDIPWIPVWDYIDPPEPPSGYDIEVERECFLGLVTGYRFVPNADLLARLHVEGLA